MTRPVILDGCSLTLDDASRIAEGAAIKIASRCRKVVQRSRSIVERLAQGREPIYGLNTGFGFFANTKIEGTDLKKMQANIIRSHAAGSGELLSVPEVRLIMALRLNLLIKGFSGVRYEVCKLLQRFLQEEIYPCVPELGSVGASGDLIPLAHVGLALMGEGKVIYRGRVREARAVLRTCGIEPLVFEEKEGLSFVNGTEAMQAVGGLAFAKACRLERLAVTVSALTFEALQARVGVLDQRIHEVRRQRGQQEIASQLRRELAGSYLYRPGLQYARVQDPYSLRCIPQVHGPCRDTLRHVEEVVRLELNGVTDNPLVFANEGDIVSGGNFHGEALALGFDIAALACAELGNVSERRLELLCNPAMSQLPAFLAVNGGTESGYMALQYLSASLVNENKVLSHPASTDSIPGNVGIEDFVSMGMTSARKLRRIVQNLETILAAELLAAAQAIDLRGVKQLGSGTRNLYNLLRKNVPTLRRDRVVAGDVAEAVTTLRA